MAFPQDQSLDRTIQYKTAFCVYAINRDEWMWVCTCMFVFLCCFNRNSFASFHFICFSVRRTHQRPAFIHEIIYAANISTNNFVIRTPTIVFFSNVRYFHKYVHRTYAWCTQKPKWKSKNKKRIERHVCNYEWIEKNGIFSLPFSRSLRFFLLLFILVCTGWTHFSLFYTIYDEFAGKSLLFDMKFLKLFFT